MAKIRILSVVPSSSTGYGCFDGAMLVDWGVRRPRKEKRKHPNIIHAELITRVAAHLKPDTILLPAMKTAVASALDKTFPREYRADIILVPLRDVERCFAPLTHPDRPNHHRVMALIPEFYPELKRFLPRRPRRIYEGPDYWTSMFDAVAQAFAWMQKSS